MNEAIAQSKELLKGYQYEAALETLRKVKALAPNKVLPQMGKVKTASAKGLTQTAKEIRPKNPRLALEMLNRAVVFGGDEAARLIPRVRRDIAAQEERAQASEQVATYIKDAANLTTDMGQGVADFSRQFIEVQSNPMILRDETWRLRTAGRAAIIKLTCEKMRELDAPEPCRSAHRKIRTIANETEIYVDQMLESVDTIDVDTINSATRHLNQATSTAPSLRDELLELKRKYKIE